MFFKKYNNNNIAPLYALLYLSDQLKEKGFVAWTNPSLIIRYRRQPNDRYRYR